MDEYLKFEVDCALEDYLNGQKTTTHDYIADFTEKQQRFLGLTIEDIQNIVMKESGESKKDYLKRVISKKPLAFISECFFDVVNMNFSYNTKLFHEILIEENKSSKINLKIKIPNLKYLIKINKIDTKFYLADNEVTQIYGSSKINYINYFTSELFMTISINTDDNMDLYFDDIDMKLDINFNGIEFKNCLFPWMEYIIEGAIYKEMSNDKMSIFKYFIAFDNFTQTNYNVICQSYNDLSADDFKQFLEYRIDNLDYYSDCLNVIDLTNYMTKKYINKISDLYLQNTNEIIEYASEIIKHEKLKNTIQKKRLINEKFKIVRDFLKIDLNSKDFSKLSGLFPSLHKVEKYRNDIAHGNITNKEEPDNVLYIILTIILSIIYKKDFESDNWNKIINFN